MFLHHLLCAFVQHGPFIVRDGGRFMLHALQHAKRV